MAVESLTVENVLQRAHNRAVPAGKAIRLLQSRIQQSGVPEEEAKYRVGAALIAQLSQPTPSALCLAYLSEALRSGVLDTQAFAIQLLFRLSEKITLPASALVAISSTLIGTQWASATTVPLPAASADPRPHHPPDVGTSASATADEGTDVPTLKLILPLLHLCANPCDPVPLPISALTARLLGSLEPYPTPPLEVGLEASGLLPQLSEAIGLPLRSCLSGLMTDLAISSTAAALNIGTGGSAPNAGSASADPLDFPPLPPTFPSERLTAPIPLSHMVSFLLTHALRSAKGSSPREGSDAPLPTHLAIMRAGRYLASPEVFLLNLLEGSLQLVMGTHQTFTAELQRSLLFVTEWLPDLLRHWKDTSSEEWQYPNTLAESLSTTFEALAANLTSLNTWISATYASRISEAENADDGPALLEPRSVSSIQAMMVRQMVTLELLDEAAANSLLPDPLPDATPAESMLNRLSTGSRSCLLVDEALVAALPGAARSLAVEFMQALKSPSYIPIPDNLLSNLSSHPSLLVALTCTTTPEHLLSACVEKLINAPIDESARADDPQGVLTKYGEGIVFIEALVDVFELELPSLLARSRRAVSLGHLDEPQKACLNGWVKALFSTEGIDDHILLSTMPQDLCWLAPSIIHQAIAATAAGRLDRDALHGGLSYFSQPLLSWCLGGIIAWLSSEVVRNGLISALHLDVLQMIILSDSTPDVLLRVNGRAISRLLDPQAGLSAVFQSAKFDAQAVKAKMDSIPSAGRSWHPTPNTSLPLNVFRSQLHVVRHLAMTQHPWSGPFLTDFECCLGSVGPVPMLDILYTELVRPTLDFDRTNGDPLAYFAPLLCALPIGRHRPLVEDLVSTFLPRSVEQSSSPADTADVYQLCGVVKSSLLLLSQLGSPSSGPSARSGTADRLIKDLMECLDGLSDDREERGSRKRQRRKLKLEDKAWSSGKGENAALDVVKKVLRADEELRGWWPGVL